MPDTSMTIPRNLVILCDGTGNQVEGDLSNVMKLYRISEQSHGQRVYYDPGVGTIGNDDAWGRLKQKMRSVWGLATGAGLDDNIINAYRFLCSAYQEGDRIFLFGFSRGAYAVRALAGLVHMVGLLPPDQAGLSNYALNSYKHAAETDDLYVAWDFGRIMKSRRINIHFVGVWDTVASMIVPRPDRIYIPSMRTLPYTRFNPSVRVFRHAISIDERRRMFRLNRWIDGQDFVADPFSEPPTKIPQDSLQQWFAGNHSDVGGGYPEAASGLSKFPLEWMVQESKHHGLLVDHQMFQHLVEGNSVSSGRFTYVPPEVTAPLHDSLTGAWRILEWLPKRAKWRETRRSFLGWYLPLGEARRIPEGATIAQSAHQRRQVDPAYHRGGFF